MSRIADKVYEVLSGLFPPAPYPRVKREIFVPYKGQKLYFDFYIKELGIYVEVQGEQHEKFVKHFQGDLSGFDAQRFRDNLKIDFVENSGKCLVRFKYNEEITKESVNEKLLKVLEGHCLYE
jgi:hypothetical protein